MKNNGKNIKGAIRVLKSLSGTPQRAILDHLVKNGKDTPSNMSRKFKKSQQLIFFNLKEMVDTGIVSRKRTGINTYYSADISNVKRIEGLAEKITLTQKEGAYGK